MGKKIAIPWYNRDEIRPIRVWSKRDLMRYEMSRMAGFLDCLRYLAKEGVPDQKYVDYLIEKTGEEEPPLMDWFRSRWAED